MILLHYTNILYTETMKSRICTQIDWKIRQNQNLETIKRATLRATLSSIKQTNHLIMGKNSTSFYSISLVTNPFFRIPYFYSVPPRAFTRLAHSSRSFVKLYPRLAR